MRLCSYNIHSGVGTDKRQDYRRIGQFLADHRVDIALLQEMDTRPAERDTDVDIQDIRAGHFTELVPSPALTTDHGWYGNSILTRFAVRSKQTINVSFEAFQPRNIQEVVVETDAGPLRVINTHKGLKRRERKHQFGLLADYLGTITREDDIPLVLAGDFNEWQFFTRAFKKLNDVLVPHRTRATFPSRFPVFKLDRVWCRPGPLVQRVRVLRSKRARLLSDHLPVMIDLDPSHLKTR